MKNKKLLMVCLALIFAFTLCFGVLASCNSHVCGSVCEKCGKCTDLDCQEGACKDKCQCHTCGHVCATCGKCTDLACTNAACAEKCEGHASNPAYVKDMDIGENTNDFEPYTIPSPGANQKQIVFYWREADHDYADNDIWLWHADAEGAAFELHECSYGAVAVINVPSNITSVGFIVRKDATTHTGSNWGNANKVYSDDRTAVLTGDVTVIYLTGANAYQFSSNDGGKKLTMIKVVSKMTIKSFKQIEYGVVPSVKLTDLSQVSVKCNGQSVEIESISSLNKTAASGTIKLKEDVDLSKNYEVTIDGYDAKTALPMEVFDSADFNAKYTYTGDDLGAVIDAGSVVFKLWAPTASKVVLNIYEKGNGGAAPQKFDAVKGEFGVWSYTVENKDDAVGKYYTYTVTTSAGAQEAVDPYAKSAGLNGMRGMVIDLADTVAMNNDVVELESYTDAIIWETHVRDFSNNIADSQYKGKYLAFTETGLKNSSDIPVGVDYLVDLGITHVHLLPVFDFKSVDESKTDGFNWGYDPQNYNVPEGSYSTDPTRGEVRVNEFKQMVDALHKQGLGVVMDMVYNHTYDKNSNLNMVVPNYYYRYNSDGSNSSGSGCGNDTASERAMFRKYMVDSVKYWVSEYKLDGLRFDLMGLHDIETMREIEQAVHAINPNAIIYGEGWTMTTAAKAGTVMATQTNIKQIKASEGSAGAIAVFNDAIRDGLRGSVFNAEAKGYMSNGSNKANVAFGILGGEVAVKGSDAAWTVSNAGVINYISAHDNHTLWDRLATNSPNATLNERLAMNRLGATIVMLSKGTPFMTAGEEILRSKKNPDGTFNENSYSSGDEVNNLKWENLKADSDELAMLNYYKGLVEMRKGFNGYFHDRNVSVSVNADNGYLEASYIYRGNVAAIAIFNGTSSACSYTLPANAVWSLVCDGISAGTVELAEASSAQAISVPACGVHVYVKK